MLYIFSEHRIWHLLGMSMQNSSVNTVWQNKLCYCTDRNFFAVVDRNIDGRTDNFPVLHNNKTFSTITAAWRMCSSKLISEHRLVAESKVTLSQMCLIYEGRCMQLYNIQTLTVKFAVFKNVTLFTLIGRCKRCWRMCRLLLQGIKVTTFDSNRRKNLNYNKIK